MGYNKTWPRALRFWTHDYCGLRLNTLWNWSNGNKRKGVRTLLYKKRHIKAITILIAWYQMASGITTPALEYTKHSSPYINSIWTNDFLWLLQKYNIKIKMKENMILQKICFNDSCTMEDILNNTTSLTNLKRLNAYRLYLGITFLSEGSAIIAWPLIGNNTKHAKINIDWPNKKKPNKVTWSMWSKLIKHIILCTVTIEYIKIIKKTGIVDKELLTINSAT